jgi:hypothetical protein
MSIYKSIDVALRNYPFPFVLPIGVETQRDGHRPRPGRGRTSKPAAARAGPPARAHDAEAAVRHAR